MRFPSARRPHENDIVILGHEGQIQELEDLGLGDGLGEEEVEGVDGFDDREVGLDGAGFDQPLMAGGLFLGDQQGQELGGERLSWAALVRAASRASAMAERCKERRACLIVSVFIGVLLLGD